VEHVLAANGNCRLITQASRVADLTVVVDGAGIEDSVFVSGGFVELFDAVFLETGEAVLFVFEAVAGVTAVMHLVARTIHQLDTLCLATYILKSRHHAD